MAIHLLFLVGVVAFAHHPAMFLGLFLVFLGVAQAYERYQDQLIIREGLEAPHLAHAHESGKRLFCVARLGRFSWATPSPPGPNSLSCRSHRVKEMVVQQVEQRDVQMGNHEAI